ncbi:hypothetical protein [Hydrogenovibrio thermophilus]|uniref:Uncharacterized protein n=1 Tax=Hydrogenovibrio thermophilus TaxID=265883 RepID=A0A451G4N5_9GAMM|nr:hypothetical protein [Hydrogenovibrio thermophilus]QAB14440.1 hypothetical protein EPV75_01515 [Hydrogenovibrio thermophilus]
MTYPDDCIQNLSNNWWIDHPEKNLVRGALIKAFIPHVDHRPYSFEPIGRTNATDHSGADIVIKPLSVGQKFKASSLPVAAMTKPDSEIWAAYRAKRRYCLVIGNANPVDIDKKLTQGKPNHSTSPTVLVSPYYGASKKDSRAGYSEAFVERVKHCEYPQFQWDHLPIKNGESSILRLDHTQAIGAHSMSYEFTGYKLSDEALEILDDHFSWLVYGGAPENSLLHDFRSLIEETIT